jgi:hypothetical protein
MNFTFMIHLKSRFISFVVIKHVIAVKFIVINYWTYFTIDIHLNFISDDLLNFISDIHLNFIESIIRNTNFRAL